MAHGQEKHEVLDREPYSTRLLDAWGLPVVPDVPYEPMPDVPTIGCEIEVPWQAELPMAEGRLLAENGYYKLPADEQRRLDALFSAIEAERYPAYEATRAAGYPKREDAFWEFALDPARHYETLAREISALYRCGLLKEGFEYPLHITLADLDA